MKTVFSLALILVLGACSSIQNPRSIYLKNSLTGEIVKCEQGHMDAWFSAMEICAKRKEAQGFQRINVTGFDYRGNPVQYEIESDPYWPDN